MGSKGGDMSQLVRGLDPIETASRDEIESLQFRRLRDTLHRVYANVPYHKKRFDEAGVHPDDFKTLSDISKFPFMAKDDLRITYPFGLFATSMDDVVRLHASSGTTGKPIVAGYTANDIKMWSHLIARSIVAAGGSSKDIIQNAYGYGLFTGGLGAHYGIEYLGACAVPISGGNTVRQVQSMLDFGSTVLMSTPSYALVVAEELKRQGIKPADNPLKVGIFGAEAWTASMRSELETQLGIDAVSIYGLTEVLGPGVASECVVGKDGPVIWEDHFYAEVIDPETGEVLPDGEEGELVFTSLTKEAFPVIRFRTRDLATILPPTTKSFRRIGPITGRFDDMLIIRGVNVFPTQIEEYILEDRRLSGNYLIEVNRVQVLDTLRIVCELQQGISIKDIGEGELYRVADRLHKAVRNNIGVSAEVEVLEFNSLPRTEVGKAKRVIDNRKNS